MSAARTVAGVLGPPVVSPCRVILVSACRRGAIYDARCRPWAARCRPHGPPRMLGGVADVGRAAADVGRVVAGVLGSPVVSPCRATGVINGAPTFGVVATGWLAAGGGSWAGRRGCVGSACGFALPGDGRHKWRPYVWCGGDGVVGRRWWMLGEPSRGVLLESLSFLPRRPSFLPRRPSFLPRRPSDRVLRRYGRGSEVHILLYITGVRGKDMCISARWNEKI